jgi:ABC-type branched-subunit amino acid transport system substrate-binding protein
VVLAVLALLAAACGRGGGGGGAGDDGLVRGPGFDGRTISVGILTPLQGPVAVSARPLTIGNQIFFEHLNRERGGIAGRYQVRLVVEDTAYDAGTAISKYHKVKGGVALFAQVYGTPVVNALVPFLAEDGVLASPASLDAAWVRNPNLLPVGAPYQVQFANGADYYLNQGGGRGSRICFLGIAGRYGDAGLSGLEQAAATLGFPIVSVARYAGGDTTFTGQLTQLANDGCQAVFLTSLPTETALIVSQAAQLQFTPRWIAQSPAWSPDFVRSDALPVMERSLWVVNEGTEWEDRSVKGQADLLDRLGRYRPEQGPDYTLTFGYVQAWAVAQVLERAVASGDLSRAGVARAAADAGTLHFDGLSGDYAYGPPGDRSPPRVSTVFKVNPARPLGIEALAVNIETETARRLRF